MSVVIIPAYKPDETLVTIIAPAMGIINAAAMVLHHMRRLVISIERHGVIYCLTEEFVKH